MILHELGTNALKYGAFAQPTGTVDIGWELVGNDPVRSVSLVWRENCPPPVRKPERTGVGTSVIQHSASLGLHGSSELEFTAGGLVATVVFPLTDDHEQEQPQ